MKPGLGNLMKQAQQMQADMQKVQAELGQLEVQGEFAQCRSTRPRSVMTRRCLKT